MENFEALNEQTNQAEPENINEESFFELTDSPTGEEMREQQKEDELYSVKYNGKEVNLTLSELKTNAQKGLNYDHIKGELENMKNSPERELLKRLSGEKNMGVLDYLNSLLEAGEKEKVNSLMKKGLSEEDAKRFVSLEREEKLKKTKEDSDKPFLDFAKAYPDVDPKTIEKSVWEEFSKSGDLITAYIKNENRQLKEKLLAIEKNAENEKKSVGSLKSGSAAHHDAFLEGLFG